ncbi:MAG: nitroreductase family protein [Chloroflexi bacterium]|nr:nitroreductase family protein [Chloroflexota bacterium]
MQPITEVSELFAHQRAVRAFADRNVPDALVEEVLAAATRAPSGSNTQPWRFIVVRDAEVKAQLAEAYEEAQRSQYGGPTAAAGAGSPAGSALPATPWTEVPVLIVACVRVPARTGRAGFQTGASVYPAVQNLMLRARSLGLGTVLTTLHRRNRDRVHAILGIPETYDSAAIIPLGWPAVAYGRNRRPPASTVTMRDRWDRDLA